MRTHNTPRLCAGPQTAGTPIKFWNVASIGDDEGEITLYGDVVSRQPVDWWTGEPEPGLYIAPESFMEDLAAVKGKSNITIKINSTGGDLYTGIAIHNAIKGLSGHKVVIVEGIAASAASVIACAGDEVQVYPGSMVMIHGVAGLLMDYYTLADLKKLQKDFDSSERAIAEIYHAKTGIAVEQLRTMMTRETWMVGQEAIDNGFADSGLEDAVALICKLCLGLLNGLAGGGAVDRKEIRDAGFVFLVKADSSFAVGHGALELAHDILRLVHEEHAAVRIGL